MKELGSEVARGGEDSQQAQPKTKNPIVRTGRLVLVEQPSRVLLECDSTNVRTGRLVDSCVPVFVERSDQDKDADENVDADQLRSGRPVESEQSIEKIESHPHREAFEADGQQNVYHPFSDDSEATIRDMCNVELFEPCEAIPNMQCAECLLYWNQVILCCTRGHLLKECEARQHFHQWRLDSFSIEIKKGRFRGARHGKTEAQKEHFIAHKTRRRCLKKEIWRNSRSLPKRFNISWFAAQKCTRLKKRALRWTD